MRGKNRGILRFYFSNKWHEGSGESSGLKVRVKISVDQIIAILLPASGRSLN